MDWTFNIPYLNIDVFNALITWALKQKWLLAYIRLINLNILYQFPSRQKAVEGESTEKPSKRKEEWSFG